MWFDKQQQYRNGADLFLEKKSCLTAASYFYIYVSVQYYL